MASAILGFCETRPSAWSSLIVFNLKGNKIKPDKLKEVISGKITRIHQVSDKSEHTTRTSLAIDSVEVERGSFGESQTEKKNNLYNIL